MICYLKSKEDKADFLAFTVYGREMLSSNGIRRDSGGHPGSPEHDPAFRTSKNVNTAAIQMYAISRILPHWHRKNNQKKLPSLFPAETVDLEKGLTPEQRRVVEHMDGPMAVIAVPGAGKTHCLIARMVRMIKNGILPEQILFCHLHQKGRWRNSGTCQTGAR